GVSADSIVANMNSIAVAIFTGIGKGVQTLVSAYHGKGKREAENKVLRLGLRTALINGGLFVAIGLFLPDLIVAIFNVDGNIELAKLATPGVRLYFTSFLFTGVNFTMIFYLAAINEGKKSMVISALRGLVFVYPAVALLS